MRTLAVAWVALALLAGCADKQVTLTVGAPDLGRIPGAGALTVFPFADRRGSEGDQDPNLVGGVYGRYGNRVAKVTVATPFARTLADTLAAAFRARGVEAAVATAPSYQAGPPRIATPFALAGELHDFSTEARFTTSAHVSGIVRLHARDGKLLYQREISERESEGIHLGRFFASTDRLQEALNKALAKFVKTVANDPELSAALSRR